MASRLWKQKWFQRIQYFYSCLYFQWAVYNIIYKYIFHVRRWVDSSWPDIGRRFILSCYWFSHNLSLIGLVAHKTHLWDSCLDQVQMGWDTLQSNVIHARFAVLAAVVQSLSHIWLFATLWKQHTGLPCPSPAPRVCSNLRSLSLWWHPTISSSVTPFSFCPQSFPSSGSFPKSQLFVSGGQSIGVSASTSVLQFFQFHQAHISSSHDGSKANATPQSFGEAQKRIFQCCWQGLGKGWKKLQ